MTCLAPIFGNLRPPHRKPIPQQTFNNHSSISYGRFYKQVCGFPKKHNITRCFEKKRQPNFETTCPPKLEQMTTDANKECCKVVSYLCKSEKIHEILRFGNQELWSSVDQFLRLFSTNSFVPFLQIIAGSQRTCLSM